MKGVEGISRGCNQGNQSGKKYCRRNHPGKEQERSVREGMGEISQGRVDGSAREGIGEISPGRNWRDQSEKE